MIQLGDRPGPNLKGLDRLIGKVAAEGDIKKGPWPSKVKKMTFVEFGRAIDGQQEDRPILSCPAAVAYEILLELPPYCGLICTELLAEMDKRNEPTQQSSLTGRIIPELKPYGVENVPRKGYRIPASKRSSQDVAHT
jgi:hypothetical protein